MTAKSNHHCFLDAGATTLGRGWIKFKDEDAFWVLDGGGLKKARKAFSCLVEPQPRDAVLLAEDEAGAYILAVLDRESPDLELRFPGQATLSAPDNALRFAAGQVDIGGAKINLSANELTLYSTQAAVAIDTLSFIGAFAAMRIAVTRLTCGTYDAVLGRLNERIGNATRRVEGLDETRAGRVAVWVKETLFFKGKRVKLLAEEQVKINGEKIRLG